MKASVTLFFLTALFVFFQTNLYADTETHWKNGDVLMLSTHTRGNGITIAIIGDGFDAEEMRKGGKYETRCRELADHFFHLPVIKDFKDLFDFYCVMAVPPVSGVNNTLGMFEGDIWIAGRKAMDFMDTAGVPAGNAFIFMGNGPVGGYALFEYRCGVYQYVEAADQYWMAHEFVGHAFAGLGDEYVSDCSWTLEDLNYYQSLGIGYNISSTDDLNTIPWRDFIGRAGYSHVGAYEGAWMCNTGFWRPEENSVMAEDKEPHYNAMSRWLIYKKIHEEAGLEFDFNTFLQYDRKFIDAAGEVEMVEPVEPLSQKAVVVRPADANHSFSAHYAERGRQFPAFFPVVLFF